MVSFKEVNDYFSERLKNPFSFNLIVIWIAWNWKGVSYFLLSSSPIEIRLICVYDYYTDFWYNFGIPILFAFFSLPVINAILWLIEIINKKLIVERKKLLYNRLTIENQGKEAWTESKVALRRIKKNVKEIEELEKEKESLQTKNDELKSNYGDLQEKVTIAQERLKELEIQRKETIKAMESHSNSFTDLSNEYSELKDKYYKANDQNTQLFNIIKKNFAVNSLIANEENRASYDAEISYNTKDENELIRNKFLAFAKSLESNELISAYDESYNFLLKRNLIFPEPTKFNLTDKGKYFFIKLNEIVALAHLKKIMKD